MPRNVRNQGSQEGYLPEYLPYCTTVVSAPRQYALKSLLLASYNGDILSAKHLHSRLSYPLALCGYSMAMIVNNTNVIQLWCVRAQS